MYFFIMHKKNPVLICNRNASVLFSSFFSSVIKMLSTLQSIFLVISSRFSFNYESYFKNNVPKCWDVPNFRRTLDKKMWRRSWGSNNDDNSQEEFWRICQQSVQVCNAMLCKIYKYIFDTVFLCLRTFLSISVFRS